MKRKYKINLTTVIIQKWFVMNSRGVTKLATKRPRLNANEVAFFLSIEVPDALFERPLLTATIKIPQEAVPKNQITAELVDNVEEAIQSVTGLEMRVSVVEPPEEE